MKKILVLIPNYLNHNITSKKLLLENNFELIESSNSCEANLDGWDDVILQNIWAVIVGTSTLGKKEFARLPTVKIICKTGKGLDNIDLIAAKEQCITITNTAGSNADAVAELVICFAIASLRDLFTRSNETIKGAWNSGILGTELRGKRVGLLGFGDIAQRVAFRLSRFFVRIYAYDVAPDRQKANELSVKLVPNIDHLLDTCDILSIHLPANHKTHNLLNKSKLLLLKKGSIVINTSRGSVIDENTLYLLLKNKHLAFAALDAFQEEPLGEASPLLRLDNVLLTPHMAGSTKEAAQREIKIITQNICRFSKGEPICY